MKTAYKVLKTIGDVLLFVVIIALVVVTVFMAIAQLSGNGKFLIGGFGIGYVVTGSMEPTIPTGSVVLVKEVPPKDICIDDTIMFYSDDPSVPDNTPVTHRVIAISPLEDNRLQFTTKGDANEIEDPYAVYCDDIIGRVEWHSKAVGNVITFLKKPWIYPVLIGLLALDLVWNIVIVSSYADKIKEDKDS